MSEQNERSIWDLVDSVSVLPMHAYVAARSRAFGHPSGGSYLPGVRPPAPVPKCWYWTRTVTRTERRWIRIQRDDLATSLDCSPQ